ncbi:hypothetical protein FRC15_011549 [Serendipita sp. 397]|nr:hypothetical protein FRC15_011549 [Serendipita sp. 397]KAG8817564.1 hypothetical protein FRC18_000450 [Serendipita sp. 400]
MSLQVDCLILKGDRLPPMLAGAPTVIITSFVRSIRRHGWMSIGRVCNTGCREKTEPQEPTGGQATEEHLSLPGIYICSPTGNEAQRQLYLWNGILTADNIALGRSVREYVGLPNVGSSMPCKDVLSNY